MAKRDIRMCTKFKDQDPFEVRVMAVAEGYAMVRRKGCMPFVVSEKQLTFKEAN